jgi:hypothetical protein
MTPNTLNISVWSHERSFFPESGWPLIALLFLAGQSITVNHYLDIRCGLLLGGTSLSISQWFKIDKLFQSLSYIY